MTKREYILIGFLLLFVGLGGYGLLRQHDANLVLEQQTKANVSTIAFLKQSNDDIASKANAVITQLEDERKQKPTPQNTVQTITKYVNVPQPVYVYGDKDKPGDPNAKPTTDGLPTAPEIGDIIIPKADAPAFRDAQLTCQENTVKLDACTLTNANLQKIDETKDKQIAEDRIALKGGSFWHRSLTAAKWLGVGVAAGVTIGVVLKH